MNVSTETSGKSRKRSKDTEMFGAKFGMQMIANKYGDGWHEIGSKMFWWTTNCGTIRR